MPLHYICMASFCWGWLQILQIELEMHKFFVWSLTSQTHSSGKHTGVIVQGFAKVFNSQIAGDIVSMSYNIMSRISRE